MTVTRTGRLPPPGPGRHTPTSPDTPTPNEATPTMTITDEAADAATMSDEAPRVLGLDLSITATGVAYPDGDMATIWPGPVDLGEEVRIRSVRTNVQAIAEQARPSLAVIEAPFVGRGGTTTLLLGGLSYVVRLALLDLDVPHLMVPPTILKVYATGRGAATKADMRVAYLRRTGTDERDDNRVDAAWLRLLGLDLLGHPEHVMPQTHRRALDKLVLG